MKKQIFAVLALSLGLTACVYEKEAVEVVNSPESGIVAPQHFHFSENNTQGAEAVPQNGF